MKNLEFCKDMSIFKRNANRVKLLIFLDLNVVFFCVLGSNWPKLLIVMHKRFKISTLINNFL